MGTGVGTSDGVELILMLGVMLEDGEGLEVSEGVPDIDEEGEGDMAGSKEGEGEKIPDWLGVIDELAEEVAETEEEGEVVGLGEESGVAVANSLARNEVTVATFVKVAMASAVVVFILVPLTLDELKISANVSFRD